MPAWPEPLEVEYSTETCPPAFMLRATSITIEPADDVVCAVGARNPISAGTGDKTVVTLGSNDVVV